MEGQAASQSSSTSTEQDVTRLEFFEKLLVLMVSVIEEDKSVYQPVLNQFPDVKIGELSATSMWNLYSLDLKFAMEGI